MAAVTISFERGPSFSLVDLTHASRRRRPLKRVIQQRLENPIAGKILEGGYADGDTVRVDHAGKTFTFGKVQAKVASR